MKAKKAKRQDQAILLALFLCTLLAASFIVRIWPLRYAYWWDETVYLQNAETLLGIAHNYDEFDFRPPVIPLVIASGFLFWHHPFMADILMALLSALAAPFIFLSARELYGNKTAILAGIIAAFSPFLAANGHYIMTDAPAVTFSSAAFYCLIRYEKEGNDRGCFISGALAAVAALTKFTHLMMVPIFLAYLVYIKGKKAKFAAFSAGFFLFIFPYLLWAQITLGGFLAPFAKATQSVAETNAPWTFYFTNFYPAYPLAVVAGLALFIMRAMLQKRADKKGAFLLAWAFLYMVYLGAETPYKEARYVLPITLPVVIVSSRGLGQLIETNGKIRKYASYAIIAAMLFVSFQPVFSVLSLPPVNTSKTEEMTLSEYISGKYPLDAIIYTNQNYPVYSYYTKRKVIRLLQEDESFYETYKESMKYDGLLIVYQGIKKPSKEWLDRNPEFKKQKEVNGITLYEYKRS